MSTAMRIEVDGEEILPEEVSRAQGWKTAGEKLNVNGGRQLRLTQGSHGGQDCASAGAAHNTCGQDGDLGGASETMLCHKKAKRVNKGRLLKGARMPDLPRADIKIILRPRGGLRVSEVSRVEISRAIAAAAQVAASDLKEDVICLNNQQNIIVASTPSRENADKYAAVTSIDIRGTAHEVSAYESAPHGTVKGVIRGIPLEDTAQEIQDYVVHKHNPTALQANRIGKTRSVVIAFAGTKVPNYVRYGNLLVECTLHRKQIDVCYTCGRLGHRMDVCPNPKDRICRGCGAANPDPEHSCVPQCSLCGGKHLTADRTCKARFKTPYVVRRRRWERRRAEDGDTSQEKRGRTGRPRRSTSSRSRSRTPARKGRPPEPSTFEIPLPGRPQGGRPDAIGWPEGEPPLGDGQEGEQRQTRLERKTPEVPVPVPSTEVEVPGPFQSAAPREEHRQTGGLGKRVSRRSREQHRVPSPYPLPTSRSGRCSQVRRQPMHRAQENNRTATSPNQGAECTNTRSHEKDRGADERLAPATATCRTARARSAKCRGEIHHLSA
ncbi:hypothetical protein HPB48_012974 [Haemaphysalis longicornis]|uniref:CCHC-type domain-containing protein n=1 Tax=Haemaphysalis longicornis TaxID=44386 RepID=A0A9J6GC98_HAELO|nr:hypothetical protein HPB48_012974 [Haemaphysalis longicornis]